MLVRGDTLEQWHGEQLASGVTHPLSIEQQWAEAELNGERLHYIIPFVPPEGRTIVRGSQPTYTLVGNKAEESYPLEDPRPDAFYGAVEPDPDNPGKWLFTPYTPEEMRPRLREYSAEQRFMVETGGQAVMDGEYATPTTRDIKPMFNNQVIRLRDAGGGSTSTIKLIPIVDGELAAAAAFPDLDEDELNAMIIEISTFSNNCFAAEAAIALDIDSGAITTKEEIDARYEAVRTKALGPLKRGTVVNFT